MVDMPKGTGKIRQGWPENVQIISLEQMDLIGIDPKTRELYWDGQKLKIASKLAWPERMLAAIATASSFIIALMAILNFVYK
ncbi:hypothetical protein [Roseibium sediminis]|uniref:hypothetical protein n=1 Tax=Roseibium sediminis TaxID=1775174 RepID=UPI00123DCD2A|nr:hypothetical protein [Roseibium sediminis]